MSGVFDQTIKFIASGHSETKCFDLKFINMNGAQGLRKKVGQNAQKLAVHFRLSMDHLYRQPAGVSYSATSTTCATYHTWMLLYDMLSMLEAS